MSGQAIFGRDDEEEALTALLDAARGGRSGALCLTGEPGIGKITLLVRGRVGDGLHPAAGSSSCAPP